MERTIQREVNFDLPPNLKERFHYLVFSLAAILPLLAFVDRSEMPDAYVAQDGVSEALRDALSKGYQWVRSDGDHAIFEKITFWLPGMASGRGVTAGEALAEAGREALELQEGATSVMTNGASSHERKYTVVGFYDGDGPDNNPEPFGDHVTTMGDAETAARATYRKRKPDGGPHILSVFDGHLIDHCAGMPDPHDEELIAPGALAIIRESVVL